PDSDVLMPLARSYLLQGKYEQLLTDLETIEAGKPTIDTLVLRAAALEGLNKRDQARKLLEQAAEFDPKDSRPLTGLARLDIDAHDRAAAEKRIEDALARNPQSDEAHALKGELRRMVGDADGALQHFNEALRLDPRNRQAHLGRAAVLIGKEQLDQAEE